MHRLVVLGRVVVLSGRNRITPQTDVLGGLFGTAQGLDKALTAGYFC